MKLNLSKREKELLEKAKPFGWLVPFIAGVLLASFILFKLVVPLLIGIINLLIALFIAWTNLRDINFIFIGAIFFFIVLWKVWLSFYWLLEILINTLVKYFAQNYNKMEKSKR